MRAACLSLLFLLACADVPAQETRDDLYDCEGCEALYEYPAPPTNPQTVIPPPGEPGEPLVLSGVVYETDGVTPAEGVVVYAHHTNARGVYPTRDDATGWAQRHGYLRGWVRTDAAGRYAFHTIRPAPYPGREAAAHIHLVVEEPGRPVYWIDEVVFEDDPLVDAAYRRHQRNRGGSGIVKLTREADGTWRATRDIVLEPHPERP